MRPTLNPLHGASLLFLGLCLTACALSGKRPALPPTVVTSHEVVNVPVSKFAEIRKAVTQRYPLAPLPTPAIVSPSCPDGCYSAGQMREALGNAQLTLRLCYGQLEAVDELVEGAINTNE